MVERAVCSTGEETNSNSLKAPSVLPSVPNDGFGILGSLDAENKQPSLGHSVLLEPEVASTLEIAKLSSSRGSASSGSASNSTGRFSLFKWFKRGSRDSGSSSDRRRRKRSSSPGEEVEEPEDSESSSTESVDTFYSTATVRSFAFHSGTLKSSEARKFNGTGPTSLDLLNHTQRKVGPFGAGAAKIVVKKETRRDAPTDVTRTLPANVLSRRRDITARYSLQPCSNFGSCGNFTASQRGLSGSLRRLEERGTGRRVHVRGKRRAPNPPGPSAKLKPATGSEEAKTTPRGSGRRKRRPAPKPPEINSAASSAKVQEEEAEAVEPGMDVGESKSRENYSANKLNKGKTASGGEEEVEAKNKVSLVSPFAVADKVATSEIPERPETVENASSLRNVDGEEAAAADADLTQSISNDTLVLQGGVLHWKKEANVTATGTATGKSVKESTSIGGSSAKVGITTGSQNSAMPRPWYKRSVFEHSRDSGTSKRGDVLRNPAPVDLRDAEPAAATPVASSSPKSAHNVKNQHEGGTLSRLNFFHRSERNCEERRKENKRKSGLSILTNISELDKEAAAIVQEEQARARAAMLVEASRTNEQERRTDQVNEEVVQDIVTSAMESSPRRGTRALISKFNAIGNITKVTVNSSFFSRSSYARDQREEKLVEARNSRSSVSDEWRERTKFQGSPNSQPKVEKDLSRYFMPQQKSPKNRTTPENKETSKPSPRESPKSSRAAADISARLSFLQGNVAKTNSPACQRSSETSLEAKISRLNDEVGAREENATRKEKNYENSPKLSRLRVHVINSEVPKASHNEADDGKKVAKDDAKKKSLEVIQNEFSSIFNEIDKQLASKEFRGVDEVKEVKVEKKSEPGTSSQVSRVLDILVEAEKGDRLKSNWTKSNRESEIPAGSSEISDQKAKKLDPIRTDLKEMLKEMKHSLPKRPKPKREPANVQPMLTGNEAKNVEEPKTEVKLGQADEKPRTSYLLNSVTVVYPPPIRIGPPAASRSNAALPEEREYDRQKVSSAAQTCGNVRKVSRQIGETASPAAKWKNEDVVYKTSGKGVATAGTSGLVKNTFQLIRPREFAQIEAIKTMKGSKVGENTYANVIGQSLYANALVPAPRKVPQGLPAGPSRAEEMRKEAKVASAEEKTISVGSNESTISSETNAESQDGRNAVDQQNMNTLAVNRLLRKLEAAIASGHHQQAAGLAKELARLKIHCSVVRQRTKAKDVVNVNMYIEDKLAHQGPIPLRLARRMTVAQLKAKVFTEFEIPTNVQRWIVGKNLADDDATTLEELQAVEGSPVFLYLVAPELKNEETPGPVQLPVAEEQPPKDPDPVEEIATVPVIKEQEEEEEVQEQAEPQIITEEEEEEEECISEEVRMERYEALISLENCDVIPNSEPIECPICFLTYGPQEGVILRDCLHMFCRPCIANTIRYCEEAEVKCPFRDTEYTCESTLQEREIKALVEPEIYQQHLAKSIAQAENNAGNNAFHCKTPDCPGWCIYDDNVNNFLCPVCGVNNCLTCQVVHTGKNCRQYQQELRLSKETDQESKRTAAMLEEMVDRGEALPCPTCAVVLMKKWGCDWLRCSMCKTEICWVTRGPRWGPGGKGDTSGGCRCGENGVKCHPRCNYCH